MSPEEWARTSDKMLPGAGLLPWPAGLESPAGPDRAREMGRASWSLLLRVMDVGDQEVVKAEWLHTEDAHIHSHSFPPSPHK